MKKEIEQKGIVKEQVGDNVFVEIEAHTACDGCHAKGSCGMTACESKIIKVKSKDKTYNQGDEVFIVIDDALGVSAIFYGYVLPLIVLLVALVLGSFADISDLHAGLLAIGCLIMYYFGLNLCRRYFKEKFAFRIR